LSELEFTRNYLKRSGPTIGSQLYEVTKESFPSLTEGEFADLIWRLAAQGHVELIEESEQVTSFAQFLKEWERNLWYYFTVAVSLVTLIVAYLVPSDSPLVFLRWGVGLLFVVLVPGYATVEALLPGMGPLRGLDRYAISVGISLVLDMLIGFLLNYTPWGLELIPAVVSLAAFSIFAGSVALLRKFMMSRKNV